MRGFAFFVIALLLCLSVVPEVSAENRRTTHGPPEWFLGESNLPYFSYEDSASCEVSLTRRWNFEFDDYDPEAPDIGSQTVAQEDFPASLNEDGEETCVGYPDNSRLVQSLYDDGSISPQDQGYSWYTSYGAPTLNQIPPSSVGFTVLGVLRGKEYDNAAGPDDSDYTSRIYFKTKNQALMLPPGFSQIEPLEDYVFADGSFIGKEIQMAFSTISNSPEREWTKLITYTGEYNWDWSVNNIGILQGWYGSSSDLNRPFPLLCGDVQFRTLDVVGGFNAESQLLSRSTEDNVIEFRSGRNTIRLTIDASGPNNELISGYNIEMNDGGDENIGKFRYTLTCMQPKSPHESAETCEIVGNAVAYRSEADLPCCFEQTIGQTFVDLNGNTNVCDDSTGTYRWTSEPLVCGEGELGLHIPGDGGYCCHPDLIAHHNEPHLWDFSSRSREATNRYCSYDPVNPGNIGFAVEQDGLSPQQEFAFFDECDATDASCQIPLWRQCDPTTVDSIYGPTHGNFLCSLDETTEKYTWVSCKCPQTSVDPEQENCRESVVVEQGESSSTYYCHYDETLARSAWSDDSSNACEEADLIDGRCCMSGDYFIGRDPAGNLDFCFDAQIIPDIDFDGAPFSVTIDSTEFSAMVAEGTSEPYDVIFCNPTFSLNALPTPPNEGISTGFMKRANLCTYQHSLFFSDTEDGEEIPRPYVCAAQPNEGWKWFEARNSVPVMLKEDVDFYQELTQDVASTGGDLTSVCGPECGGVTCNENSEILPLINKPSLPDLELQPVIKYGPAAAEQCYMRDEPRAAAVPGAIVGTYVCTIDESIPISNPDRATWRSVNVELANHMLELANAGSRKKILNCGKGESGVNNAEDEKPGYCELLLLNSDGFAEDILVGVVFTPESELEASTQLESFIEEIRDVYENPSELNGINNIDAINDIEYIRISDDERYGFFSSKDLDSTSRASNVVQNIINWILNRRATIPTLRTANAELIYAIIESGEVYEYAVEFADQPCNNGEYRRILTYNPDGPIQELCYSTPVWRTIIQNRQRPLTSGGTAST